MQSKASTVDAYLKSLPEDRRTAVQAVREVFLKNLDKDYEEGMQYGMIGYYVPHKVFPPGYHCDPKQPLPFAGLASQKNHMSLYMMSLYGGGAGDDTCEAGGLQAWFQDAWAKTGKKLDMGKCCIRFKKLDDLALDVIAEAIRRTPARKFIEHYEASILIMNKQAAERSLARKAATASKKSTGRKSPAKKSPTNKSATRKK